jgi:WhiB family redox-sensing transcriptional regulator
MSYQWRNQAACLGQDIDLFYNVRGAGYREARALCSACPVRGECLLDVMEWERTSGNGRFGFIAGLSPDQRRELQQKWDARQVRHERRMGERRRVPVTAG